MVIDFSIILLWSGSQLTQFSSNFNQNQTQEQTFFYTCFFAIWIKLEDNNIADYKDGLLSSESLGVADMFNDAIERFIKETTSWPGQSHYRERLNKFQATIFQKCRSVYNCNKLGYNVLNHGDFHFKNTMYKFDGDDLKDVLFVSTIFSIVSEIITYVTTLISLHFRLIIS